MSIVLIRTFILYFIVLFAIRNMQIRAFKDVTVSDGSYIYDSGACRHSHRVTYGFIYKRGYRHFHAAVFTGAHIIYFNQKREVQKLHKRQAECNH